MKHIPVTSTMIDRVGYDEKKKILEVRFVKKGAWYRYFDVEKEVYEALLAAESKGTLMHEQILESYDYALIKRGAARG